MDKKDGDKTVNGVKVITIDNMDELFAEYGTIDDLDDKDMQKVLAVDNGDPDYYGIDAESYDDADDDGLFNTVGRYARRVKTAGNEEPPFRLFPLQRFKAYELQGSNWVNPWAARSPNDSKTAAKNWKQGSVTCIVKKANDPQTLYMLTAGHAFYDEDQRKHNTRQEDITAGMTSNTISYSFGETVLDYVKSEQPFADAFGTYYRMGDKLNSTCDCALAKVRNGVKWHNMYIWVKTLGVITPAAKTGAASTAPQPTLTTTNSSATTTTTAPPTTQTAPTTKSSVTTTTTQVQPTTQTTQTTKSGATTTTTQPPQATIPNQTVTKTGPATTVLKVQPAEPPELEAAFMIPLLALDANWPPLRGKYRCGGHVIDDKDIMIENTFYGKWDGWQAGVQSIVTRAIVIKDVGRDSSNKSDTGLNAGASGSALIRYDQNGGGAVVVGLLVGFTDVSQNGTSTVTGQQYIVWQHISVTANALGLSNILPQSTM